MTATLEDPEGLLKADRGGLLAAFLRAGGQLEAAYREAVEAIEPGPEIGSVTICGMGGSAAAGDVVTASWRDRIEVPVITLRGQELPAHCRKGALVVCVSYSGNTEETLSVWEEAVARGCRTVAVCAGGRMAEIAGETGAEVVAVPPGAPRPRAALGALVGGLVGALEAVTVISSARSEISEAAATLDRLADEVAPAAPESTNDARAVARWLGDRIPVTWGTEGIGEAAAWRWKCGFNENAKIPAFSSAIPELDHHEVVGWSPGTGPAFGLVVLRHFGEHPSSPSRLTATLEAIEPAGLEHREVWSRGSAPLSWALSLMLMGDVTSAYHALSRGVDPAPIPAIDHVKARLAERGG